MSAGDLTQGTRRPDGTELHDLKPGEYAQSGGGLLWLCLPNGLHGAVNRENWTITEEDDGTITVSPSILTNGAAEFGVGSWHGYLEHGVWREV